MSDTISPACGTFLGDAQACEVAAVVAVETGARYFDTRPAETTSPTLLVVALTFTLGACFLVMSNLTRRNGRRVTTERVTK